MSLRGRTMRAAIAVAALLTVVRPSAGAAAPRYAVPPPLAAWSFKQAADGMAWIAANPGAHGLSAGHGRLQGSGDAPPLLSPPLDLRASAHQIVELRVRVDRDTELVVVPDSIGPRARGAYPPPPFVRRSRHFETVRVSPFWQGAGRIGRLALRLPASGRFEIESIRVIDLTTLPEPGTETTDDPDAKAMPRAPSPRPGPLWEFARSAEGWTAPTGVLDLLPWLGTLYARAAPASSPDSRALVLSPPADLDAGRLGWATVRLRSRKTGELKLLWTRAGESGAFTLPIRAVGSPSFHAYAVDLAASPDWRGRIAAVGLELPRGAAVEIDFVHVTARPEPSPPDSQPDEAPRDEAPRVPRRRHRETTVGVPPLPDPRLPGAPEPGEDDAPALPF